MALLSFFLNILATEIFLNLLLRKVHLSLSLIISLIYCSRFFLSDMEEVFLTEESGVGVCFRLIVVLCVFRGGEGVGIGDVEWNVFHFVGCFVAATCASSTNGDVVERGCRSGLISRGMGGKWKSFIVDASSEDRVLVINWDHDCFMVDVDGIEGFSWFPSGPVISDVEVSTLDEGSEEVEIIVVGVHANENNPVVGTKGEDGRGSESCAGEFMVD